jgi:hypothetical protein
MSLKWGKRALDSLNEDIRDHIERETQDTSIAECRQMKRTDMPC